jgi:hypothetical protein
MLAAIKAAATADGDLVMGHSPIPRARSFMVLFIVEEQESSPEETEISRRDEFRSDVG